MKKPVHFKEEGTPTQKDITALLSLIGQFRTEKLYNEIGSADIFGIRQEDGAIHWCTVLGQGGMEFGLSVFYGNKSLEAFKELVEDPQCPDCYPFRDLNGVYFNLVNKSDMEQEDMAYLEKVHFKTYGRGKGWPLIRRYLPNHAMSAHFSKKDCNALGETLALLPAVIEDYKAGKLEWKDLEDKELFPVLSIKGEKRLWTLENPAIDVEEIEVSLDEFTEAKLAKLQLLKTSLFIGNPMLYMPIESSTPPQLPEATVIVDMSTGMILNFGMHETHEDIHLQRAQSIAHFLLEKSVRPEELVFDDPILANCFHNIFKKSNTKIDCYPTPDVFYDMLDEMTQMMGMIH